MAPIFWNVMYDGILGTQLPIGTKAFGFADDLTLVITAKHEEMIMSRGNAAIKLVDK